MNEQFRGLALFRAAAETLSQFGRSAIARMAGLTYGGDRDMYNALGYKRVLTPADFRARMRRNAVANRIVNSLPMATWRGGCEIIEDEDPETVTTFEQAVIDLDKRLKIWDKFLRADKLAGLGRYSVILIGAPGELNTPLVNVSGPDDIFYLQPYAEEDATVQKYVIDKQNPRFGLPDMYEVKRTSFSDVNAINRPIIGRVVHWSRIIHISDGLLDDNIFAPPRLECVWNLLDDLEKVTGSGAEAFWNRADGGTLFSIDPTLDVGNEEREAMRTQIDEYKHALRKVLTMRGVEAQRLGSDVADFKSAVEALMSLISAGTGIPQRVLMGSEQGKLAAKQDRANWDNRVTDRQNDLCGPMMVRPFFDRLIEIGALPEPEDYEVKFTSITTMDDEQRADMATKWAALNKTGAEPVVTTNEIRTQCLGLAPIEDVLTPQELKMREEEIAAKHEQKVNPPQPVPGAPGAKKPPFGKPKAAAKKGGAPWKNVHKVADRFRSAAKAARLRGLRLGPRSARPNGSDEGAGAEG